MKGKISNRMWLTMWVIGLLLYSLAMAYLYRLPEVRFFVGGRMTYSAPERHGCVAEEVIISEEAVKHQLQQNKRLLDLPKPKDTGGFQ